MKRNSRVLTKGISASGQKRRISDKTQHPKNFAPKSFIEHLQNSTLNR
jgi:hypothetical protein